MARLRLCSQWHVSIYWAVTKCWALHTRMLNSLDPFNALRRLGTIQVVALSRSEANNSHLCHSEWSSPRVSQGAWGRASQELPFAMMLSLRRRQSIPRKKPWAGWGHVPPKHRGQESVQLEDIKIIKESWSTAGHTPHSNVFAGSQRKVSKVRVLWKQLKQTAREWSVFYKSTQSPKFCQSQHGWGGGGGGVPWI